VKGILFTKESIQAIAERRKTVTRRVDKLADKIAATYERTWVHFNKRYGWWELKGRSEFSSLVEAFVIKPRYQVGETVYIKEAWYPNPATCKPIYKADYPLEEKPQVWSADAKWQSPLFMPAEAAHYFILIKDVRAERLQEITEEDAIAEGVEFTEWWMSDIPDCHRIAFGYLWDSINKDYPWESNPFVFRYEFKLVEGGK
jgi:hypothetical protein